MIKVGGSKTRGGTIRYERGGSYTWRAGVGGGSSTNSNIPSSFWGIEDVSDSNTVAIAIAHSTQNVGIGTTSPGEALEVIGNISASGNITAVSMSGDGSGLTGVSSTATVSGNTFATDLKIGRDADNLIDFTTDNQIQIRVGASNELKINTSTLFPAANDGLSLGGAHFKAGVK